MSGNVMVVLSWDETFPGWRATAKTTKTTDHGGGRIGFKEFASRSDCVKVNPMAPIIDVLDLICQEADMHPARLDEVTVVFDGRELHDTKDRTLR